MKKMMEVNELYFAYKGNTEDTIKNISFSVGKGKIFGFLGPSGAGKSTVQKILIGILKDYRGNVKVFHQEISKVNRDYYEKIGVSFELPNLYSKFTALENLNYFGSFYSNRVEDPIKLLKAVGLEVSAKIRVSHFSKGMKMRLNFCRALLNRPEIIFLDEPTSGLDPVNSKLVKDIIINLKQEGRTIFLTTHNMTIADELCDQVAFIVDGKINLIDSPRALKVLKGEKSLIAEYRDNGKVLSQKFSLNGIGANEDFIKILKEKEIETMHTQEATLENIFIEVTGRSLT
jgi:fluoroquinolone transport system ATP-binding protein